MYWLSIFIQHSIDLFGIWESRSEVHRSIDVSQWTFPWIWKHFVEFCTIYEGNYEKTRMRSGAMFSEYPSTIVSNYAINFSAHRKVHLQRRSTFRRISTNNDALSYKVYIMFWRKMASISLLTRCVAENHENVLCTQIYMWSSFYKRYTTALGLIMHMYDMHRSVYGLQASKLQSHIGDYGKNIWCMALCMSVSSNMSIEPPCI